MFNLRNIMKAVLTVATVARAVIQQAAKRNPQVARVVEAVNRVVQPWQTSQAGAAPGTRLQTGRMLCKRHVSYQ